MYLIRHLLAVTAKTESLGVVVSDPSSALPSWLDAVREQVNSLRFGQVQIVVHESRVVQIERIEKIRLETKPPGTK
ncbi:MAG TPA: YezD family protein [Verrucomicrobiota bacterium]|nr:hypothetical protein [Verrucomicrobiales bacterium]HRI12745.1 YezD family protein [Verrucomicrobiota bacterium]